MIAPIAPEQVTEEIDVTRIARFASTKEAIRRALSYYEAQPPITDDELNALIDQARKAKPQIQ